MRDLCFWIQDNLGALFLHFGSVLHFVLCHLLGDLPVGHGPASPWPQGAETRQRATFLVPCLLDFCGTLSTPFLQAQLYLITV